MDTQKIITPRLILPRSPTYYACTSRALPDVLHRTAHAGDDVPGKAFPGGKARRRAVGSTTKAGVPG